MQSSPRFPILIVNAVRVYLERNDMAFYQLSTCHRFTSCRLLSGLSCKYLGSLVEQEAGNGSIETRVSEARQRGESSLPAEQN